MPRILIGLEQHTEAKADTTRHLGGIYLWHGLQELAHPVSTRFSGAYNSERTTFYLQIDNDGRRPQKTLEAAPIMAELAMVTAIREMLPFYKLLVDRLENRHRQNIIPMKPKD